MWQVLLKKSCYFKEHFYDVGTTWFYRFAFAIVAQVHASLTTRLNVQVHHTICWQDWRQQRSMLLLDIVSTTSLNLPLEVPTLSEAIQNVFSCGVSWINDLVGPHLKSATLLITAIFTSFNTRSLLRTAMFYEWSKILQPDVLPNTNTFQNQHSEKLGAFPKHSKKTGYY